MSSLSHHMARLWSRTDFRLALLGLSGVLAVYLGFLGISVGAAELIIKRGGYYLILLAFVLFLQAGWAWWRGRAPALDGLLTRRQIWVTAGAIALFAGLAIGSEPYWSKILNDEFVLQSTAFNLHYFRDVAMMVRGYDVHGVFLSTDSYLDKRPYFYPFLISLVHDFTGYRPLNAYLLNTALLPVALALGFVFGRMLAGWRSGLLAVIMLGSLPLLGQNATGSGMELLNIVMILGTLVLAAEYLRAPREETLAVLGLAAVLLAQSRYESALYVLPVGIVACLGWIRAGRLILPWQLLLVPLLLVPCALQNKVLSNSPLMWELNEKAASRFSFSYFPSNAVGAWQYLFARTTELSNSRLLSAVGLVGLGWGVWQLIRGLPRWRTAPAGLVALAAFGLTIAANTLLVFCYYWSSFADRMASRFSLPLHLVLVFCAVMMMKHLDRWWPATRALLGLQVAFFIGITTTQLASHGYSHVGVDEVEWERRFIAARPAGQRIIISNKSTLPWLLQKTPSILVGRARFVGDRLAYQLQAPDFCEILVLQCARPTSADGDFEILPQDRLPEGFKVELLAEKRFGTKLARISRLVSVDLPPKALTLGAPPAAAPHFASSPGPAGD